MKKILVILFSFILMFVGNDSAYANREKLSPTGKIYLLSILSSKGLYVDTDDLISFFTDFENISKEIDEININSRYFIYNLLFKNEEDSDKVFNKLGYGGSTRGGGASRKFTSNIISEDIKTINTDEKLVFDYDNDVFISKKISINNVVYYIDLYEKGAISFPYRYNPKDYNDIDYNSSIYNYDKDNINVKLEFKNYMTYLTLRDKRYFFFLDGSGTFAFLHNQIISFDEDSGYYHDNVKYKLPNLYLHIYSYKDCFITKSLEVPFYSYFNNYAFDEERIRELIKEKSGYIKGIFDKKGSQNFDLSRIIKCIPFSNLIKVNEKKDFNYIFNYPFYDYFSKYNDDLDTIDDNLSTMERSINEDLIKDFNEYLHDNVKRDIDRGYYVLDKNIIKYKKVDNNIDNQNKDCCICNIDYSLIDKIVKNNLTKYYENNIKTIANNVDKLKVDINYLKNNISKIDDIDSAISKINAKIDMIKRFDTSNLVGVEDFNKFKTQYNTDIKLINEKLDNNKIKINDLSDDEKDNLFNNFKNSLDFVVRLKKFFEKFFTVTEKFDFKKIESSKLVKKIPFSIFYDLKNIIGRLFATPKVPVFEFPIYKTKFVLDFNKFESLAVIVRFFVLFDFVIFIILKLINKGD